MEHLQIDATSAILSAIFSPDGTLVLTTSEEGMVQIFCTHSRQRLRQFGCYPYPHPATSIDQAVFSKDGTHVLTASQHIWREKGAVQLWNITTGKKTSGERVTTCVTRLDFAGGQLRSAEFSP